MSTTTALGPWRSGYGETDEFGESLIICMKDDPQDDARVVALISPADKVTDDDIKVANLIAAAPELRKALQDLMPHLPEAWRIKGSGMFDRVHAAEAAIAKTTGEQA